MVPWTRVRRLSTVGQPRRGRRQVGEQHFSRWPVVEPETGRPVGYLLAKDLIGRGAGRRGLDRPGPAAGRRPARRRRRVDAAALPAGGGDGLRGPGRRAAPWAWSRSRTSSSRSSAGSRTSTRGTRSSSLRDAVLAGGVVLEPVGPDAEQAIAEMAAAIPGDRLPPGARIAGPGDRPRARVSDQPRPRRRDPARPVPGPREAPWWCSGGPRTGSSSSPSPADLVHLIFLLVTPAEKPNLQVFLLGQLARVAGNASSRERLLNASSPSEVIEVITGADHPIADGFGPVAANNSGILVKDGRIAGCNSPHKVVACSLHAMAYRPRPDPAFVRIQAKLEEIR